jgi:hypothetical protein
MNIDNNRSATVGRYFYTQKGENQMAKGETYEEFVEKFKSKKTTDDCYTPENVYNAIADWVAKEYEVEREKFVRPFYPGGDFESYDYNGKIVVDNPPFSILAKILSFYEEHKIKFFLFSPTLTLFSKTAGNYTMLPLGVTITYDNGAGVNTSFVTNLEPQDIRIRTVPELYRIVDTANKENLKQQHKQLPKYSYPPYLITAAQLYPYSRVGIELKIPRSESTLIRSLDSQKKAKKTIFGAGYLVSERCKDMLEKAEREKAEREKAEREKAERWQLSEREMKIIESLSQ